MLVKVIDRDPSLPHQIVIGLGQSVGEISVSCNCRWDMIPMDYVPTGDGTVARAVEIYNQPSNHNPDRAPFHPDIDRNEYRIVEVQ